MENHKHQFILGYCCSCFFIAQMPVTALRINIFMQKGREENECKEQEKCSEHKDGAKEQTPS